MSSTGGSDSRAQVATLRDESAEEMLDNAPCGFVSTLPDGTIVSVNRTFLEWTGFERSNLLAGRKFHELLTGPGRLFYETHFRPLLFMQGAVSEIACHIACGEHGPLPVLVNSNLRKDASGQPSGIRTTVFRATERTRYEQDLRLARAKADELGVIVKSSSDAIISRTIDGVILTWNPAAELMLGYAANAAIGQNIRDLVFPPARQALNPQVGQSQPQQFDTICKRRDGTLIEVSASLSPIQAADGSINAVSVIYRDITVRNQVEARLRESELRLAAALHAGELGVHDHDLITGQIIWDETLRRIWGVSADEPITPDTFDTGVHPDDLPGVEAELAAAFEPGGRGHYRSDYRVVGRDGITRWVRADGDVTFEDLVPVRLVGTARDISELKRTEQALRESESRFWAAFENSSLPMSIVTLADGVYRHVNRACEELFGSTREQMIGRSPGELGFYAEPDERQMVRSLLERDGYVHDFEVRWRGKDGKPCTHLLSTDPISLQGEPCFYAISHDITQRKEIEAALHTSEARFRGTFENAAVGVAHVALDGSWLSANDKLCSIVGYSREELLSKTFQDITHPDDLVADLGHVRQVLSGEINTYAMDKRYIRKDGSVVWIGLTVSLQRRDTGEPNYFIAIVRDISERVQATEALRESEARYRALAEASDTIVWRTTPSGDVVFASNMWNELTGQTEQETAGRGWLDAIHPDDRNRTIEKWHASLESQTLHTNEFRIRVADGGYRWFGVRGVPILNEDGTVREWMGANTDIHDSKMGEEELRESEARLKMALHAAKAGAWEAVPNRGEFVASDQALALYDLAPGTAMTHDKALAMVPPDDRQRVEMELRRTLDTGAPYRVELRARQPDGSIRWLLSQAELRPGLGPGRLVGLVQDITEQKQREQQIQLLIGEVNHRSKNLLGVVMSVARQTGGPNDRDFVKRFGDRVQGLAASHDLLVHNQWQSVDLASLVRAQLSHFESLIGTRITIRGEAVRLSPAAAQTIGMALHELATNASKYGALTDDKGQVEICWEVSRSAGPPDRRFTFRWKESEGPPVVAPTRYGFGSTVTGKIVKASLAGEVTAEFARSGFVWHLNCPFEKLVADHAHDSL